MAKKPGIVKSTNSVGNLNSKGPYSAREIMSGSKAMARGEGKLTNQSGNSRGSSRATDMVTKSIAGESGKGPLTPREVIGSSKRMSCSHGVTVKNNNTNMDKNTGGYRIGAGCRTFRHGLLPQQGGGEGAGHHGQPAGHKKGFNT